jgi:hypothetical protein
LAKRRTLNGESSLEEPGTTCSWTHRGGAPHTDSSVAERMSRSDGDSDLLAEWFQNKAIHIPIDQWSSVAALEDATRRTGLWAIMDFREPDLI